MSVEVEGFLCNVRLCPALRKFKLRRSNDLVSFLAFRGRNTEMAEIMIWRKRRWKIERNSKKTSSMMIAEKALAR